MAKIKIELGGEYTAAQTFKQAQADVKKFGRENKDAADIATKSLQEIAGNFGAVGKAAGAAEGVIKGLATGGIFGMIASLASTAIGLVVDWFNSAKEKAKLLSEIMNNELVTAFNMINEKISGVKSNVADAEKSIDSLLKTAQGTIDGEVKMEVARLHIETLQKITDGMSEAGKKLLEADEALQAETIKYNGELKKFHEQRNAIEQKYAQLAEQRAEAEQNVINANNKKAEFEYKNAEILQEYWNLQSIANSKISDLVAEFGSYNKANEEREKALLKLNEIEKEHKDVIQGAMEADKTLSAANAQLAEITSQLAGKEDELAEVAKKEKIAGLEHEGKTTELTNAKKLAKEAVDKETIASGNLAKAKELEADAVAKAAKVTEKLNQYRDMSDAARQRLERWENKLADALEKNHLTTEEYNTLMKELIPLLEETGEDEEVLSNLQKKLKEVREKLIDSEEELTDSNKEVAKDTKEGKRRGTGASAASNVSVNIDRNSINQIPDAPNFPNARQQEMAEARRARERESKLRANTRDVQNWLKGEMPKAYKQQWEKWAITHLTKEDWQYLGDKAIEQQMLSKSEQKQQKKYIEDMKNAIEKALTTR